MKDELFAAAAELLSAFAEAGLTLSAAESCTGGWFSKTLVDVPGASEVFLGGVVSYTNGVKEKLLGVPAPALAAYTAVSAPVAAAMAEGVCRATGARIGVSVTGLAGPGGGSEEIPVGRVFIGVTMDGVTETAVYTFPGDRTAVRRAAVLAMMERLSDCPRRARERAVQP